MPRVENTVVIDRSPEEVFTITNDIEQWPELFNDYSGAQIVNREEAGRFTKLTFRLKNKEGAEWQSWRLLDHKDLVAIAERENPLFPFRYMHLKWTYQATSTGTVMTWTQDFELDPECSFTLAEALEHFNNHASQNQARIKELIESRARI